MKRNEIQLAREDDATKTHVEKFPVRNPNYDETKIEPLLIRHQTVPMEIKTENFLGPKDGETALTIASLRSLRELSSKFVVGPRIVSETLGPQDDPNANMTFKNQNHFIERQLLLQELEQQSGKVNERFEVGPHPIVENIVPCQFPHVLNNQDSSHSSKLVFDDRRARTIAPWNVADSDPAMLTAYMDSMQEQEILHRKQAFLLQRDREILLNQAVSHRDTALNFNLNFDNVNGGPNLNESQIFQSVTPNKKIKSDCEAKVGKSKRGRPKRNPAEGWPKRPLSAYNIFFKDYRQKLLGSEVYERPVDDESEKDLKPYSRRKRRKKHGKISFSGLAKSVGLMWKELSPEVMAHYERKADVRREAYQKEIKDFLEKRNRTKPSQEN